MHSTSIYLVEERIMNEVDAFLPDYLYVYRI